MQQEFRAEVYSLSSSLQMGVWSDAAEQKWECSRGLASVRPVWRIFIYSVCGRVLQPEWHPKPQMQSALRRTPSDDVIGRLLHINDWLGHTFSAKRVFVIVSVKDCFVQSGLLLCDLEGSSSDSERQHQTERRTKIEMNLLPGSQLNI